VSIRWRSLVGVSIVTRSSNDATLGAISFPPSSESSVFNVYDSNGRSSTSRSWRTNVSACSPSLGAVGDNDVVVLDANENALGLDCWEFGSSNLSMLFNEMGVEVRLRTVSGGAIRSYLPEKNPSGNGYGNIDTRHKKQMAREKRVWNVDAGEEEIRQKRSRKHTLPMPSIAYLGSRVTWTRLYHQADMNVKYGLNVIDQLTWRFPHISQHITTYHHKQSQAVREVRSRVVYNRQHRFNCTVAANSICVHLKPRQAPISAEPGVRRGIMQSRTKES
jgi:hypothetical protein